MMSVPLKKAKAQGFSLLEAAITLSVIGLVTGTIWVIAAEISENRRVEQMVTGSIVIYENVEKMYNGYTADTVDFSDTGAISDNLRNKVLEGVSGYTVLADGTYSTPDPDIIMTIAYNPPGTLAVEYTFNKKKPGLCYKLASGLIERAGPDLNSLDVATGGPSATISPSPGYVPMPTTTKCKNAISMTVEFQ